MIKIVIRYLEAQCDEKLLNHVCKWYIYGKMGFFWMVNCLNDIAVFCYESWWTIWFIFIIKVWEFSFKCCEWILCAFIEAYFGRVQIFFFDYCIIEAHFGEFFFIILISRILDFSLLSLNRFRRSFLQVAFDKLLKSNLCSFKLFKTIWASNVLLLKLCLSSQREFEAFSIGINSEMNVNDDTVKNLWKGFVRAKLIELEI